MSIAIAVQNDLKRLPQEAQDSAIAALALSIAKRLDSGTVGLRDLAAVARELRLLMQELAGLEIQPDDDGDLLLQELRSQA